MITQIIEEKNLFEAYKFHAHHSVFHHITQRNLILT